MVKKTGCYIIICVIVVMSLMVYPLFAQQKRTTTIKATYYHDRFNNRKTSSGEKFFQKLYTAAHKTLPFNTIVKITNPQTSRSVLVKINDRCRRAGIVDLSKTAAQKIDLLSSGIVNVTLEVMPDDYMLLWSQQESIYAMFDSVEMPKEMQIKYLDSLYNTIANSQIFSINYYVKIATVESENEAQRILYTIPEKYRLNSKSEKIYNENFFDVVIGPFITKEMASVVLSEMRSRYPTSHLIKK